MEKVLLFIFKAGADFNRLVKTGTEMIVDTLMITKIDSDQVSGLIEICNSEKLPIDFGQFGIIVTQTTPVEKKSKSKK